MLSNENISIKIKGKFETVCHLAAKRSTKPVGQIKSKECIKTTENQEQKLVVNGQ